MIKVFVADDQSLIRSAVVALLEMENDISVIGEAESGEQALALIKELKPDVALLDIRMPHGDGIWATQQILESGENAKTRVLILTTFEEDEFIFRALRAGASGFLGKGTDGPHLVQAVRAVASGESLLSPVATRKIIEEYLSNAPKKTREPRIEFLTYREKEILERVGLGMSNTTIAENLFISPLTVKTHINRIMSKLAAHDRSQLVIEAYESGLIQPGQNEIRH